MSVARHPVRGQLSFGFLAERIPRPTRHGQTKPCEECGQLFARGPKASSEWNATRFCSNSCGQKARRRRESRCPDEQTLRRLYLEERLTTTQIGERYGVSDFPVGCWLKKYDIPRRSSGVGLASRGVDPPDRDTLNRLIYEEFKTYQQIADIYGVDFTAVPHWLDKHGIPRPKHWNSRNKGVESVLPDAETLRSLYADGNSLRRIGEMYGVQDAKISQLCDQYGIEKKPGGFNHNGGQYYVCQDGREVRSSYEMRVANWLFSRSVAYEYEPPLPFGTNFLGDFLANGWHIEVWGVAGNETYEERKKRKIEGYVSFGLPLIELYYWHFSARDAKTLERRLSQCLTPPA